MTLSSDLTRGVPMSGLEIGVTAPRKPAGHRGRRFLGFLLVFLIAFGVGTAYVRATGPGNFYQKVFSAAVLFTCQGRLALLDPSAVYGAAEQAGLQHLHDFLGRQRDTFACSDLPTVPRTLSPADVADTANDDPWMEVRPDVVLQGSMYYLMALVGAWWKLTGISWSGLPPVFGLLVGLSGIGIYGLFRLAMPAAAALPMALLAACSPAVLYELPHLRDYAKMPFFAIVLWLIALLALRRHGTPGLLALAGLCGATIGIGFGFRTDLVILVPLLVMTLVFLAPGQPVRELPRRLAALAVAGLAGLACAWPVLSAYRLGDNTAHVMILGQMLPFDAPLGITSPVYDNGHLYKDSLACTLIKSYADRLLRIWGEDMPRCAYHPLYTWASDVYFRALVAMQPADFLVRIVSAATQSLMRAFTTLDYGSLEPVRANPGLAALTASYDQLFPHIRGGSAVGLFLAALMLTLMRSLRGGMFLLLVAGYLGAVPFLQFASRHTFHLDVLFWYAVGITLTAAGTAAAGRGWPSRRDAVVAFGVLAVAGGGLVGSLELMRWYQQNLLRVRIAAVLDAPRRPVAQDRVEPAPGLVLIRPVGDVPTTAGPPLGGGLARAVERLGEERLDTAYYLVRLGGPACAAETLNVAFRYRTDHPASWDFSRAYRIGLDRLPGRVLTLAVPAFYTKSRQVNAATKTSQPSTNFEGLLFRQGDDACLLRLEAVSDFSGIGLLPFLHLPDDWAERSLFQRFNVEVVEPLPIETVESPKPEPPPVSLAGAIWRLDPQDSTGWQTGTPQTAIHSRESALAIVSDIATSRYQLLTAPVATEPQQSYVVDYAVDILEGNMMIGVLDAAGSWIVTRRLAPLPLSGQLQFVAPDRQVRVVLANSNTVATVSRATLGRLAIHHSAHHPAAALAP